MPRILALAKPVDAPRPAGGRKSSAGGAPSLGPAHRVEGVVGAAVKPNTGASIASAPSAPRPTARVRLTRGRRRPCPRRRRRRRRPPRQAPPASRPQQAARGHAGRRERRRLRLRRRRPGAHVARPRRAAAARRAEVEDGQGEAGAPPRRLDAVDLEAEEEGLQEGLALGAGAAGDAAEARRPDGGGGDARDHGGADGARDRRGRREGARNSLARNSAAQFSAAQFSGAIL